MTDIAPPSAATPNDYILSLSPEQIEHDQKLGSRLFDYFYKAKHLTMSYL